MATKIQSVGSLQKGSYVILEGAACRVVDMQVSRPGKHGHAKVRLTAVGLVDEKKRIVVMPAQLISFFNIHYFIFFDFLIIIFIHYCF